MVVKRLMWNLPPKLQYRVDDECVPKVSFLPCQICFWKSYPDLNPIDFLFWNLNEYLFI